MNLQEALAILKEKQITDSIQMLRRWIRQGKIEASMVSKKEGYSVNEDSLNAFIKKKQKGHTQAKYEPIATSTDNRNTYEAGLKDGAGVREYVAQEAVSKREKELILKGLKEDTIRYSATDLLKGFPNKMALQDHFILLKITSVTLNHLGMWLYDDHFGILIDIKELPYPNRNLKARAKKAYTQQLFAHFEKNK